MVFSERWRFTLLVEKSRLIHVGLGLSRFLSALNWIIFKCSKYVARCIVFILSSCLKDRDSPLVKSAVIFDIKTWTEKSFIEAPIWQTWEVLLLPLSNLSLAAEIYCITRNKADRQTTRSCPGETGAICWKVPAMLLHEVYLSLASDKKF